MESWSKKKYAFAISILIIALIGMNLLKAELKSHEESIRAIRAEEQEHPLGEKAVDNLIKIDDSDGVDRQQCNLCGPDLYWNGQNNLAVVAANQGQVLIIPINQYADDNETIIENEGKYTIISPLSPLKGWCWYDKNDGYGIVSFTLTDNEHFDLSTAKDFFCHDCLTKICTHVTPENSVLILNCTNKELYSIDKRLTYIKDFIILSKKTLLEGGDLQYDIHLVPRDHAI